ncbi:MAG: esterase-like activity of phytase family protein, partial [Alphaproteobacteria bacterium]|nr:esterase-like activity of phytase family protein [Alphaproteobacteria bacterium]
AAVVLLALSLTLVALETLGEPITVTSYAVPLNDADANHVRAGQLLYRGGLMLSSNDERFGGLSGILVADDGSGLVAISDEGSRIDADLFYDRNGDLAGVGNVSVTALIDLKGRPLTKKKDSDAEAIARGTGGEIIVAFERNHRIWRYLPDRAVPEPIPPPKELKSAPRNGGLEALTVLDDGRLFALCEACGSDDTRLGWVRDPKGWGALTYVVSDGFQPTGAATLPGGDVLVLERHYSVFTGVAARLRRIAKHTIQPGARLTGILLAELRPPMTVDNMEGVDARRGPKGEVLVYLVSDDNFNRVAQRTLLLMFELVD